MIEKFQLKGGISEPNSDIPPNWRDMRSEFGYKLLCAITPRTFSQLAGKKCRYNNLCGHM